eukprot:1364567-Amorphochlora_amoeboformis.AAC.1
MAARSSLLTMMSVMCVGRCLASVRSVTRGRSRFTISRIPGLTGLKQLHRAARSRFSTARGTKSWAHCGHCRYIERLTCERDTKVL